MVCVFSSYKDPDQIQASASASVPAAVAALPSLGPSQATLIASFHRSLLTPSLCRRKSSHIEVGAALDGSMGRL